jgi:hypothetical protein
LLVKLHKSLIKFWKGDKLSPRFLGPFEVVEKKAPVDYQISFSNSLRCMHDVFHVSVLRHYSSDPSHVIDMIYLQVSDEGSLMVEPIQILDHRIQQLGFRIVNQVKFQWDNYIPHSATWEDAYEMRQQFPYFLDRLNM